MAEKHDVFVGNVTFNTTEEQLQEIFSFVGPIKNIRILTDQNTGRPKGFAFIEYSDANTALAAIRHLDGHELNNRKLRVSYSNNSNLKEIARSIGQVIPDIYQTHISTKQEYQAGKMSVSKPNSLVLFKYNHDLGSESHFLLEFALTSQFLFFEISTFPIALYASTCINNLLHY